MLSLISLGRGLWQKFQTAHPVIRWGGAILVGLVVLEFVAQEAISLYVQTQTARATIEKANMDARKAQADACTAIVQAAGKSLPVDANPNVHARVQERIDAVCGEAWGMPLGVFNQHGNTPDVDMAGHGDVVEVRPGERLMPGQDLMTIYRQQLKDAGVPADQIEDSAMAYCLTTHNAKACRQ